LASVDEKALAADADEEAAAHQNAQVDGVLEVKGQRADALPRLGVARAQQPLVRHLPAARRAGGYELVRLRLVAARDVDEGALRVGRRAGGGPVARPDAV